MLEKTSRMYMVVGEILGVISSLIQPILIKKLAEMVISLASFTLLAQKV